MSAFARPRSWFRCLGAALALSLSLATLACVDPDPNGDVGGTALYVFDGSDSASSRVQVWDDVLAVETAMLKDGATMPSPSRTLGGSLLDTVKKLGIGGMTFDSWRNRLFLVDQGGTVVVVERARSQNGTLSSSQDIWTFKIGNTGLGGSGTDTFGQATVDPTGNLYVTESNDSKTGIWMVAGAGGVTPNTTVTATLLQNGSANDQRGTGVAVSASALYGFFGGGAPITSPSQTQYTGPRIRKGGNTGFADASNVLVGTKSSLGPDGSTATGSLAYDSNASYVYVAPNNNVSAALPAALIFKAGDFSRWDLEPYMTLASVSAPLAMITHPWNKDWLAGAPAVTTGSPSPTFWIWKNPGNTATEPVPLTLTLGSTVVIRSLAFDGSNG